MIGRESATLATRHLGITSERDPGPIWKDRAWINWDCRVSLLGELVCLGNKPEKLVDSLR